jgi:cytochrome P450
MSVTALGSLISLDSLILSKSIQQILLDKHEAFEKGEVLTRNLADAMGEGLFVTGGDHWRNQRTQVQPAFYRERLNTYVPEMRSTAEETVGPWHDGQVVDVNDTMTAMRFARMEMKTVLATILDEYSFKLVSEPNLDLIASTNLKPGEPIGIELDES